MWEGGFVLSGETPQKRDYDQPLLLFSSSSGARNDNKKQKTIVIVSMTSNTTKAADRETLTKTEF